MKLEFGKTNNLNITATPQYLEFLQTYFLFNSKHQDLFQDNFDIEPAGKYHFVVVNFGDKSGHFYRAI